MEHFYDIEEFKGGGRISPENSATDFPKGTLGVGKNGKVWINLPDKNGRLSWKPTENDFPISYIFSFGYWDEETFDFQIKLDGKELFKLRYAYEYENSYLVFTYPNGDTQETAGSLYELLDFFNDNFVAETFDLLNTNPNINGELIQSEVRILFGRLKFLINNKGLRSPEKPATPKFKVGDKIKLPTTCWGRTPEGSALGLINLAKAKNQPFLYVDEIVNEANGVWLTLNEGVGVKDIFKIEEDNLELYEDPKTPDSKSKFKVGDKVQLPKSKLGKKLPTEGYSFVYEEAINKGQDYLYVIEVFDTEGIVLATEFSGVFDIFDINDDDIKLYSEEQKAPENIIQKGEFFERKSNVWLATENSVQGRGFQYIVMESYRYFKADIFGQAGFITFNENDTAHRKFGELKCGILYDYKKGFGFRCEKGKLEIIEPNITNLGIAEAVAQRIILFLATFDLELSNEFEAIWKRLEDGVVREMIRADWRVTPKDCEADASKIISSQVKKFYDRNKTRIDNLESNFSCKIIQALVSLSEYEKCGSPSSATLGKAKTDLLSKISKLKA